MILYSRKIALLIFIAVFFTAHQSLSAPSVSSVSGTISHGAQIVVTGNGFGVKGNPAQAVPAAPLVWDTISEQFVGGVNRNAYAGLNDGDHINRLVWQTIGDEVGGQPLWGGEIAEYSTSRPRRHSRISAMYSAAGTKMAIGDAIYPNGNLKPPSTQKRFYLSFYRKLAIGANLTGGGDGATKIVRIDTEPWTGLGGTNVLATGAYTGSTLTGAKSSWVWAGTETTWIRWEVYVDTVKHWFDAYKNGHYHQGTVGANTRIELRPPSDWRFNSPALSGYAYDPGNVPGYNQATSSMYASLFSYDDGHENSNGQIIDMSEIYYDDTQARVEISDQATWDQSPTATATREVQGRLLTWSDNQITLELYQGAFDSLAGKYLYVIDEDGSVNTNGYLLSDASSGLPFIGNGGTFTLGTGGTLILQ